MKVQEFASTVQGHLVDLARERIFPAELTIKDGTISHVREIPRAPNLFIAPPLVNAHNHIESMLVTPSHAGKALLPHGVLAVVSDPHEIANVCGAEGVRYMIEDSKKTNLRIKFGAPSCVPATNIGIETSGAELSPRDVIELLSHPDIGYLAEVMNYPAVLRGDPGFGQMIAAAKALGKPVDGHAPGLRGADATQYAAAGISTDHECVTAAEAFDKINAGMKILAREGSAARNLDALAEVIDRHPNLSMLCTDDLHPDLAVHGSIDRHVARLVGLGIDPLKVLRAASWNPNEHYGLGLGMLRVGDPADFILIRDLKECYVESVVSRGRLVAHQGGCVEEHPPSPILNNFRANPITQSDIELKATGKTVRAIAVIKDQLITGAENHPAAISNGFVTAAPERDLLKIVVLNRYTANAVPAVGFVTNFGLKHGALASSVAHDCHNIIAVGANDEDLVTAINMVVAEHGGLSFARGAVRSILPLPVAGLMANDDHKSVAARYIALDALAKEHGGTPLNSPFMTLSFLGLLVIRDLKISDKGLFENFTRVPAVF